MAKRRFEMYQYRNALARMRQGDSDRDIARSKTMGRKKLAQVREIAGERGWLSPELPLPDDGVLATLFARKEALPASCLSTLEPWREQVTQWHAAGIQGSTIHATLVRNHGYAGSYSSVYRFLGQLVALQQPDVPLRLTLKPGEAAQMTAGIEPDQSRFNDFNSDVQSSLVHIRINTPKNTPSWNAFPKLNGSGLFDVSPN